MKQVTTIGIDLAKNVFQICVLGPSGQIKLNRQVKRKQLLNTLRQYPEALIAMEACGSSHYWGRQLQALGMTPLLIPAQHVKAFTRGNKNDTNDALAIAEAARRPSVHGVSVKSIEQQDVQTLLRIRSRHQTDRKTVVNQIRGLLSEYGIILPKGMQHIGQQIPRILEDAINGLTPIAREGIDELYQEYGDLTQKIDLDDIRLKQLAMSNPVCCKLMRLRGIGVMTAQALYCAIGDPMAFKNGRAFAAWLGLVPKHSGTGGKVTLGGVSKRGSATLRTLMIHGARTLVRWLDQHNDPYSQWAKALIDRRGKHKAIVAMANKNARHVWVVLTRGIEAVPTYHLSAV